MFIIFQLLQILTFSLSHAKTTNVRPNMCGISGKFRKFLIHRRVQNPSVAPGLEMGAIYIRLLHASQAGQGGGVGRGPHRLFN